MLLCSEKTKSNVGWMAQGSSRRKRPVEVGEIEQEENEAEEAVVGTFNFEYQRARPA